MINVKSTFFVSDRSSAWPEGVTKSTRPQAPHTLMQLPVCSVASAFQVHAGQDKDYTSAVWGVFANVSKMRSALRCLNV